MVYFFGHDPNVRPTHHRYCLPLTKCNYQTMFPCPKSEIMYVAYTILQETRYGRPAIFFVL